MAPGSASTPLLQVQDLQLQLPTAQGPLPALRALSFTLQRGQSLGLIGESGSGKSLTALALMGLLPAGARLAGSIRLQGQELTTLDEAGWCRLRGRQIGMVFQEPMTALNPVQPIGRQVAEPLRVHLGLPAAAAQAQALRLLDRVRLPQAAARLRAYPHQLSGGQRQRVLLAMALACGPALLLADEPTTALDATTQREVLDLIATLCREDGMALLLISHDLALLAERVDRLAVMYAGLLVEEGPTATVLAQRAHPYTQALYGARPRLGQRLAQLAALPGRVPPLGAWPPGCPFADRCPRVLPACSAALPPWAPGRLPGHRARCLWPA
jgi:peptide/nickel transport system ATP-binding protein